MDDAKPIGPIVLGAALAYGLIPGYRLGKEQGRLRMLADATRFAVGTLGAIWAMHVARAMSDDELLEKDLLDRQGEKTMPDTDPKDPTDLPTITIFRAELESPFRIPSTRELVLVLTKDSMGRVTGVRVEACLREETPSVRAERALDRIGDHVIDSGVAILEVSAFAWSHVAGSLQWAARKVGASV